MSVTSTLIGLGGMAGVAAFLNEKRYRRTHPVSPGLQEDISLPHEQPFELYQNAFSLCSMKARVCLAELQIPYKSHHIDLIETGSYENIGRRFLAVNPAGSVPVLVHNGHPVYESHEQIRYAAKHANESCPSLVPSDPQLKSEMDTWIDLSSITGDPIENMATSIGNAVPGLTMPIFAAMIEDIPYRAIAIGFLFHFDRRRPLLFTVMKVLGLRNIGRLVPAIRVLEEAREHANTHLDRLEAQLSGSGGPWILGETFTLADVSWLVIFERFDQVDALHVFLGAGLRPQCEQYWERLKTRPSYDSAIVQHSHPLVVRGRERIRSEKARDARFRSLLEGLAA